MVVFLLFSFDCDLVVVVVAERCFRDFSLSLSLPLLFFDGMFVSNQDLDWRRVVSLRLSSSFVRLNIVFSSSDDSS